MVGFCVHGRAPKRESQTGEEPEQAPLLDYNNRTSTTTRLLPHLTDKKRGSYTKKKKKKKKKKKTTPCFCFDSEANFRGSSNIFRSFYPYPYWIQEFLVKGLIRAGLSHVGLIRRIFGHESDSHSRGTDSRGTERIISWSHKLQLPTSRSLVFRPTLKTKTSYCETVPWC